MRREEQRVDKKYWPEEHQPFSTASGFPL